MDSSMALHITAPYIHSTAPKVTDDVVISYNGDMTFGAVYMN